ncbi:non-hydrolyzing UDP-N-acetylglucosamine 2-epimerase [Pseudoxanthomonas putridarboris]|uniref:UDP-N-acetylglucosamine 2-epimerase (Non-hydrolyzing) n=1 Tax=Pseudoxanthomonas putridarboris TaxID=752605 RepID=A0ABU9J4K3_9GAMM
MTNTDHSLYADLVIGTRPNIVKAAPLLAAMMDADWCHPQLVFLMQHTDAALASEPMADLGIPANHPIYLHLTHRGYGARLGEMIEAYSARLNDNRPDLVIVFGDVDTTLAAAYAAKRSNIPLAHVEAGLRSNDRSMPEELNRLLVDAITDIHFTTSEDALQRLVEVEGHLSVNVHNVGNLMIDSLISTVDRAHGRSLCVQMDVLPSAFGLATFHRPSNVDSVEKLQELLQMLRAACSLIPIILPLHPRTAAALSRFNLENEIREIPGLTLIKALRYRDFVSLLSQARVVLTDSGGLQEECSILGVHCLTVRTSTERPVTLRLGSNQLVTPAQVSHVLEKVLNESQPAPASIPLWDGRTAQRIVTVLQPLAKERSMLAGVRTT